MNLLPELAPFWRSKPLSEAERMLWEALNTAHWNSTRRANLSHVAVQLCAKGGASYVQSVAGALMTLGTVHGPIEQTFALLVEKEPLILCEMLLGQKRFIPGWGNSFVRGQKDELWVEVDGILEREFLPCHSALENITAWLHARGKNVFPNPSAYTAVTAIILEMPREISAFLFVGSRLAAWAELFLAYQKGAK